MVQWDNRIGNSVSSNVYQAYIEDDQTQSFRGSKSRNKVSVGEPAEGSLLVFDHCASALWFEHSKLCLARECGRDEFRGSSICQNFHRRQCVSACACALLCARARFRVFLCSRCACYFASDINCVQLWIALFVELQVLETFNWKIFNEKVLAVDHSAHMSMKDAAKCEN